MKKARLRALTQSLHGETKYYKVYVEMKKARLRALTHNNVKTYFTDFFV